MHQIPFFTILMESYKNYDCDISSVCASLDELGIAVIPGVIPSAKCAELRDRAWQDIGNLIGLSRDNPATYRRILNLSPLHSMLIQGYGIGHMQWVWDIRQDPSVATVFSEIWQTTPEELLVSFDAISFNMPPEVVKEGWFDSAESYWIHTDQRGAVQGRDCVQGFINLYPINPGDATLMILEGSHKHHASFFDDTGTNRNKDFLKVPRDKYDYFYSRGCEEHRVFAGEGSLVLWDSRTFHQGANALRERSEANFRLVTYVCMTPRYRATAKELEKKRSALDRVQNTSHVPHQIKTFNFYPFSRKGGKITEITPETIGRPVLTELGRRLAGFN